MFVFGILTYTFLSCGTDIFFFSGVLRGREVKSSRKREKPEAGVVVQLQVLVLASS